MCPLESGFPQHGHLSSVDGCSPFLRRKYGAFRLRAIPLFQNCPFLWFRVVRTAPAWTFLLVHMALLSGPRALSPSCPSYMFSVAVAYTPLGLLPVLVLAWTAFRRALLRLATVRGAGGPCSVEGC